jgi:hypothetical protein
MRPPEDLGGQQVAQEISRGGSVLAAYAINVQKQEMVADYYEKRRLIDEAGWAASEAVTGDEEADRKLWQRFEAETKQIAQSSKWKDTNSLLSEHINRVVPNWAHAFRTKSLGIRADNAKDQLRLEWSMALENSDMKTATEIVDKALRLGVISQTEYDNFIKVAPSESHLLRAERFLAEGNNKDVLSELDKTKGMKLTTDQLKRRTSLRLDAEKAVDDLSRELMNDVLGKIASGIPLNEVGDLIQQTAGLDQIQKAELMDIAIDGARTWQKSGVNPYTSRQDDKKYWDAYERSIDGQITLKELREGVGKYWTIDDYKEMKNIFGGTTDKGLATEKNQAVRDINAIMDTWDYTQEGALPVGAMEAAKISARTELESRIKEENLRGRQLTEEAVRIARRHLRILAQGKTAEQIFPTEKQFKGHSLGVALGLEEIWDELNEAERRTAAKALSQGKSPEEVINYLKQYGK